MNPSIFFQSLSKLIIDKIVGAASPVENRILARHYGERQKAKSKSKK